MKNSKDIKEENIIRFEELFVRYDFEIYKSLWHELFTPT